MISLSQSSSPDGVVEAVLLQVDVAVKDKEGVKSAVVSHVDVAAKDILKKFTSWHDGGVC
ncbi:hypothetical protein C5167_031515 [Papaver somniferum]|uniref:Uncharacterized protein n=1 Tax=Papaver somniferum TaxID=3469 RepID=A0A4Y7K7D5_PAPSO|nr:hypothetical protein C5167_031515 [Papaver somniferum]